MRHIQAHRTHGFTLIEIMVALVIFSMIAVGAFTVLTQLQRSQVELDERSAQLETLQRLNLMAWHDIVQAVPRAPQAAPAASSLQLAQPGVLVLTMRNWQNPLLESRSNLAVIRYTVAGDTLVRQLWPFATPVSMPPALQHSLASPVTNVRFQAIAATAKSVFPGALQVTMTLPALGNIAQTIPMVQAP